MRVPRTQRRQMGISLLVAGLALIVTVAVVAIGTRLILDSNQGQEVESSALEGPVRFLPESPTALIGVVDDAGRLSSVAALALSPDGNGGAIMPMSASADTGADQNDGVLRPLAAVVADSENGGDNFLKGAESISNLKFDMAELVNTERFEELFGSIGEVEVSLGNDIADSDSGEEWNVGDQRLEISAAARLLTATNLYVQDWYYDAARYAVWRGIALRASEGGAPAPDVTESPGTAPTSTTATTSPAALTPSSAVTTSPTGVSPLVTNRPANMNEFVQRLLAGPVVARGLGITAIEDQRVLSELDPDLVDAFGSAGVPSVVYHNTSEATIVGSAIAPGRFGATKDGPTYRLVAAFSEEDLAGRDFTRADVVKQAVDRLTFAGANVRSVVILDEPAREVTLIEVAREDDLQPAMSDGLQIFVPNSGDQDDAPVAAQPDGGQTLDTPDTATTTPPAEIALEQPGLKSALADVPIVGIDVEVFLGLPFLDTVVPSQTNFDGPFTMELSSNDPLSLSPEPKEIPVVPKGSTSSEVGPAENGEGAVPTTQPADGDAVADGGGDGAGNDEAAGDGDGGDGG